MQFIFVLEYHIFFCIGNVHGVVSLSRTIRLKECTAKNRALYSFEFDLARQNMFAPAV